MILTTHRVYSPFQRLPYNCVYADHFLDFVYAEQSAKSWSFLNDYNSNDILVVEYFYDISWSVYIFIIIIRVVSSLIR